MTSKEILSQLKSLGSEKLRLQNKKHGASDNQFGVKMGDIRKLAKPLKTNQPLALELWKTGNMEAMLVAILIMDPKKITAKEINQMVHSIDATHVADWFSSYIIKEHPGKEALRLQWMEAENPWAARAGWSLTAGRVAREPEDLDLKALLARIEKEMPDAPKEVQWTMNTTLAQIGIHFPAHRKRALAIGEKLGLYRDYPVSKGCTSPFAPIWIEEMVRRQTS